MRSTDRQGLWTRLGTQVQALQTHYRYPLHFHQRMECGHIMIDLATKGGPTSVQRKPNASLSIQIRPETNESRVRPLTAYHRWRFTMRIRSILGALVIAALPFTSVWAENMTPEEIQKLVDDAVTKRLQEHERREGAMERREGPVGQESDPGIGALPDVAKERRTDRQAALSFGSTGSGRLVYAKPFVNAPKAIVGGYMDIQYRSHRKGVLEGYGNG